MADSGDDNDSRTASVGMQRNPQNTSNSSSRHSSHERSRKRQKRMGNRDVRDFVPQGATFSANPLEVDPDSASSLREGDGSEPGSHAGDGNEVLRAGAHGNMENEKAVMSDEKERKKSAFDTVNDRYWRSRSESASAPSADDSTSESDDSDEMDDSEDDDDTSSGSISTHLSDESADSGSIDSEEADDSIVLNIGSRNQENRNGEIPSQGSEYDPESQRVIEEGLLNGKVSDTQDGMAEEAPHAQTKEDALRRFLYKYPTAPSTLMDLGKHDFEIQAKYLHFNRDINDLELQTPIGCTECLREGHLADVCPSKECVHCGSWNQHQSSLCPSWRRCQKCRVRGHAESNCAEVVRNDESKIPCDFCGSIYHLEFECDQIWKFPQKEPNPGPVLVSVSCANCASNRHLIGDCPNLRRPMVSSSWTLRGFEPDTITNINSVTSNRRGGPAGRGQRGMRIRGRADPRSPSPSSDELMTRPRQPIGRNAGRPNIQIGRIGRGRNGRGGFQGPPSDFRGYRDDQDFPGDNSRQRSLSPIRGRGDTWKPPPRNGRGSERGRGARGRGSKRGGEAYRPLPSAGKKAWDRYRL